MVCCCSKLGCFKYYDHLLSPENFIQQRFKMQCNFLDRGDFIFSKFLRQNPKNDVQAQISECVLLRRDEGHRAII